MSYQDALQHVVRHIGGLEKHGRILIMLSPVVRHIGGLEITPLADLRAVGVVRHIGGLEINMGDLTVSQKRIKSCEGAWICPKKWILYYNKVVPSGESVFQEIAAVQPD